MDEGWVLNKTSNLGDVLSGLAASGFHAQEARVDPHGNFSATGAISVCTLSYS
jgi:hypothetical protein